MPSIRTLDLFAGAGGLSLGFRQADLGFEPVFAVEIDPAAARTFKRNFDCPVYDGPIEDVDRFESADVIIGGPPCQGFSPLGRDRDADSRAQLNELWQQYLRAVRQVQPLAFVIENVPEFQRSAEFARLLELMGTDPVLRRYGYNYGVLNAADYGVPQRRRRGIMVAVRDVTAVPWPPPPTHGPESRTGARTGPCGRPSDTCLRCQIAPTSPWTMTDVRTCTSAGTPRTRREPATGRFPRAATGSTSPATARTSCPGAGPPNRPAPPT